MNPSDSTVLFIMDGLVPDMRAHIRFFLDPVSRIMLQRTCTALLHEDAVFALPVLFTREQELTLSFPCERRPFAAFAVALLEQFGQPCFDWFNGIKYGSLYSGGFWSDNGRCIYGEYIAKELWGNDGSDDGDDEDLRPIRGIERVDWKLFAPCPDPWPDPHTAVIYFSESKCEIHVFRCSKCEPRSETCRWSGCLEFDAPTLVELWCKYGALLARVMFMDQKSDEWFRLRHLWF